MKKLLNKSFANVRKIAAQATIFMLFFAVVSCESAQEPYTSDGMEEECVEEYKCECDFDDDFDLSKLNEENCISRWAVEFTLKYEITDCPLENPKIKALEVEHNVTFSPSFPGTSSTVLMRYFTLIGEDCSNFCYVRAVVRAFLATGMFEYVRVFGIAHTTN